MRVIDARNLEDGHTFDAELCIIGSGPSGLTLAQRLAGSSKRICVLESGDLEFSARSQWFSRGDIAGEPYEPLDICRVRRMGGSTGRQGWGGWCKTLSSDDFEARSHVPNSGWPISYDDMIPHYRRAFETCGFDGLDAANWAAKPGDSAGDVSVEEAFLAPMTDFADGWHALAEGQSDNITFVYNATVTNIATRQSAQVVDAVEFSDGRHHHRVCPELVVLATGGIENARLLLLSNDVHTAGIGNQHDVVGRYFMEHPRIRWGLMHLEGDGEELVGLDPSEINRTSQMLPSEIVMRLRKGLVLSKRVREEEGLLASRTWLQPVPDSGEGKGAQALREAGFWIAKGRRPPQPIRSIAATALHPVDTARALYFYKGPGKQRLETRSFSFNSIFEQTPQPESRVSLSDRRDRLGLPRARLDWRIDDITRRTFTRTQEILADHLKQVGHKVSFTPYAPEEPGAPKVSWVRHHMGTTRMSDSPRTGVVDKTCKVFGMHNLFIAGSSVFPTGGNDMVTLTAIALAHLLADHLQGVFDTKS